MSLSITKIEEIWQNTFNAGKHLLERHDGAIITDINNIPYHSAVSVDILKQHTSPCITNGYTDHIIDILAQQQEIQKMKALAGKTSHIIHTTKHVM